MSEKAIDHERLGRHIEQQFRLITQIFTTSLVAAVAVLGYGLSYIGRPLDISPIGLVILLAPLVMVLPSGYLILGLRREIFQWGAFIRVYIDPGADLKYETKVAKYRRCFKKDNSLDSIAFTYWGLCATCFGLYIWQLSAIAVSMLWCLVMLPFAGGFVHWGLRYMRLPARADQEYEAKWNWVRSHHDHTDGTPY